MLSIPIPEVVTVDGLPDDVMLVMPWRIPVEIRPDGRVCIRADDLRHVRAVRVSESRLCKPVPANEAVGSPAGSPEVVSACHVLGVDEGWGCVARGRGAL